MNYQTHHFKHKFPFSVGESCIYLTQRKTVSKNIICQVASWTFPFIDVFRILKMKTFVWDLISESSHYKHFSLAFIFHLFYSPWHIHDNISYFFFFKFYLYYTLVFQNVFKLKQPGQIVFQKEIVPLSTTRMIISVVKLLRIHHVRRNIVKESEARKDPTSFLVAGEFLRQNMPISVFPRAGVVALSFPSGHWSRNASEPAEHSEKAVREKYYYRGKSETIPRGRRSVTFGWR